MRQEQRGRACPGGGVEAFTDEWRCPDDHYAIADIRLRQSVDCLAALCDVHASLEHDCVTPGASVLITTNDMQLTEIADVSCDLGANPAAVR